MTEALLLSNSSAATQRPHVTDADLSSFQHQNPAPTLLHEITADDDDGEIACICAFSGDDGNTIQCDKCLRWQHISCYYPPPKEVPGEDQKHYCTNCVPQDDLDARKATERQRKALEQRNNFNGVKRPAAKSKQKKVKDSPSLTAQANGWSERHNHIHAHDRKSASPRDQPPPAKKTKTSHRSSNSVSNPSGRKRAGTANAFPTRSPSKSPELNTSAYIPFYSEEFLHLFEPRSPQVETDTNLMNNIAVTNLLSDWLTDSDAVSRASGGLTQSEIFKRWDGRIEDIPGRPEVDLDWIEEEAPKEQLPVVTARYARITVQQEIASGTFIGELRGRIGHKDEYLQEADSRWNVLYHPEPFVFFHPQLPICVDARQEGSVFRYVRRSCQPNAELQTIITEGTEYHFCFMATKDIMAGEEVTVAWQVPDTIRERISSSLNTSNNFQGRVRDYISTWVSTVLANCGPCACHNGEGGCLMAHYDRRGRPPPTPNAKPVKRKKKLPALDTAASRSRSTSEARKVENEEDGFESRSASGSHASRDITPNTHYSGNHSHGPTEMSEREKKKLMREEEMFRKQEVETGRSKKKRHSGGSALNTPGATTSKSFPAQTNGSARYADASTSSRPQVTSRSSSTKRKASSRPHRKDMPAPAKTAPSNYVDATVQCDLDPGNLLQAVPQRARRRYISVSQRLLQKCVANASKPRIPSTTPPEDSGKEEAPTVDADNMDVDDGAATVHESPASPKPKHAEVRHLSSPPAISRDGDTHMADVDAQSAVKAELPPLSVKRKTPNSPTHSSPTAASESQREQPTASVGGPPQAPAEVDADDDMVLDIPAEAATPAVPHSKLTMHIDMPPPPLNINTTQPGSTSLTPSLTLTQSPTTAVPGPLSAPLTSVTTPLLSPSVTNTAAASPIRKKMSLSDYTKRNKARESLGGEGSSGSASGLSRDPKDKDDASLVAAMSVSPGPSSQEDKATDASAETKVDGLDAEHAADVAAPTENEDAAPESGGGSDKLVVAADQKPQQSSEAAVTGPPAPTADGHGVKADS